MLDGPRSHEAMARCGRGMVRQVAKSHGSAHGHMARHSVATALHCTARRLPGIFFRAQMPKSPENYTDPLRSRIVGLGTILVYPNSPNNLEQEPKAAGVSALSRPRTRYSSLQTNLK